MNSLDFLNLLCCNKLKLDYMEKVKIEWILRSSRTHWDILEIDSFILASVVMALKWLVYWLKH